MKATDSPTLPYFSLPLTVQERTLGQSVYMAELGLDLDEVLRRHQCSSADLSRSGGVKAATVTRARRGQGVTMESALWLLDAIEDRWPGEAISGLARADAERFYRDEVAPIEARRVANGRTTVDAVFAEHARLVDTFARNSFPFMVERRAEREGRAMRAMYAGLNGGEGVTYQEGPLPSGPIVSQNADPAFAALEDVTTAQGAAPPLLATAHRSAPQPARPAFAVLQGGLA